MTPPKVSEIRAREKVLPDEHVRYLLALLDRAREFLRHADDCHSRRQQPCDCNLAALLVEIDT